MMFKHRHYLARAMQDLPNFTPVPSEWNEEDRITFEEALKIHGERFRLIQLMLPEKSMESLVQHYYSQARAAKGNRKIQKLLLIRKKTVKAVVEEKGLVCFPADDSYVFPVVKCKALPSCLCFLLTNLALLLSGYALLWQSH